MLTEASPSQQIVPVILHTKSGSLAEFCWLLHIDLKMKLTRIWGSERHLVDYFQNTFKDIILASVCNNILKISFQ